MFWKRKSKLDTLEEKGEFLFPPYYKKFYKKCVYAPPSSMTGTHLFNKHPDLRIEALELLAENKVENFLQPNDFVFMMHQGYMFWYFKADGLEDPDVYFYVETEKRPRKTCPLQEFIENYPEC
jgi:hypothetical protein